MDDPEQQSPALPRTSEVIPAAHEIPDLEISSALSAEKSAELARLRAAMGFISPDDTTPRIIDERYELERKLGAGGMGIVYLARDIALDDTRVALKLVRDGILGELPSAPLALRREAQQMAKLRDQAHVVKVYDVGTIGPSTYLTMEYVDGPNLRLWLRAQERTRPEILKAYLGAARGLAAAHAIGLIHRDFKPDNVLIDPYEIAKVTDFGIATLNENQVETEINSSNSPDTELAILGGTLPYIAPECLAGERADARSDQFSFCMALWEALAGELPYRWHNAKSQSEALDHQPTNIGLIPDTLGSSSLRRCLLRGLAKRRADRYPSMGPIIVTLERALDRPRRVRRAMTTAVGLVGAAALGVVTFTLLNPVPSLPPMLPPTCEPFVAQVQRIWNTEHRAVLAERSAAFGMDSGWTLDKLDALALSWSTAARATCEGDQRPPRDNTQRICLERWLPAYAGAIELLTERGDRHTLARAPEMLVALEPVDGDFCTIAGFIPADPELARLDFETREAAWSEERELAETLSQAVLERARKLNGERLYSVDLAHAHAARGQALHRREEYERASEHFMQAEEHALAVGDIPTLLKVYTSSAWALAHEDTKPSAEAGLRHLAKVTPLQFANSTSSRARSRIEVLETRALLTRRLGHYMESATYYNEAVRDYLASNETIFAARALIGLANLEHERGRYKAAERELQRALELLERTGLPAGYRQILTLSASYDLAIANYYSIAEIEDDAEFERVVDDVLEQLRTIIDAARPVLRLKALAAACQIQAETYRKSGLRELIDETRTALDRELPLALSGTIRAQVELSAALGLGDPAAEAEIRSLIASQELDLAVRTGLARTWVEHLEEEGSCDKLALELELLRKQRDFTSRKQFMDWMDERAGKNCH